MTNRQTDRQTDKPTLLFLPRLFDGKDPSANAAGNVCVYMYVVVTETLHHVENMSRLQFGCKYNLVEKKPTPAQLDMRDVRQNS